MHATGSMHNFYFILEFFFSYRGITVDSQEEPCPLDELEAKLEGKRLKKE